MYYKVSEGKGCDIISAVICLTADGIASVRSDLMKAVITSTRN